MAPSSNPNRAARRLLVSFGLATALVLIAVGLVMTTVLRHQAVANGQEQAIGQASTVTNAVLETQLRPADLQGPLSPARRREIGEIVDRFVVTQGIYRAQLFGADGALVYASGGQQRGSLPAALRGRVRSDGAFGRLVTRSDRPSGKAIEALVPVRVPGSGGQEGVLRAYLAYEGVISATNEQAWSVGFTLLIGGLAIVGVLIIVVGVVSRRLRAVAIHNDRLAKQDSLTGLANRRYFTKVLEAADRNAQRRPFALVVLDVDGFKGVNDTLGHHHGDDVLKILAERIGDVAGPDDFVARIGGDEFALLVRGDVTRAAVERACDEVVAQARAPISIGGVPVVLGASIGVALSAEESLGSEKLLQRADLAMRVAKSGHGSVEFYCPELGEAEAEVHRVSADLRRALAADELVVHYQPQAAFGGQLTGFEALVRWQHPDRGLVPPDSFISIAERTGLIRPLTFLVLRAALRESARLRANGTDVTMAVNLSALLLQDRTLTGQVVELLAQEGVPAHRLELEITESSLIENIRGATEALEELAALGVRIAVDDWGTGFSSLQHLRMLPVGVLKIDRSLICAVGQTKQGTLLVESTISLSRGLGLEVVAEGVETAAMWNTLAGLGCDIAQGFLLARPMPSRELDRWLAARQAPSVDRRFAA